MEEPVHGAAANATYSSMIETAAGDQSARGAIVGKSRGKSEKWLWPQKRSYSRPGDAQTDDGFLGANAPWFGYDRAATRQPDVTVPLFSGTIHQSSNRLITAEVPTPNTALLDKSKNYRIDHPPEQQPPHH